MVGVFDVALTVSDGERRSAQVKTSIIVYGANEDPIYRILGSMSDVTYSASRNELVYLPADTYDLVALNLNDFTQRTLPLDRRGYRVAVSPNGQKAVVSHRDYATLIDLDSMGIDDVQFTGVNWGNTVLDKNGRAFTSPVSYTHLTLPTTSRV